MAEEHGCAGSCSVLPRYLKKCRTLQTEKANLELVWDPGAWQNSGLRRETPDALRAYMDAQPKEKLKDCLRIMDELTNRYGVDAAVSAMEMACSRGNINICDASVLAAGITGYGIYTPPEAGTPLSAYDEALLQKGVVSE